MFCGAAQHLQEIDKTAFVCPRRCRAASAATPDGGTRAARPFSSRRTARAARPVAVRSRFAIYATVVGRTAYREAEAYRTSDLLNPVPVQTSMITSSVAGRNDGQPAAQHAQLHRFDSDPQRPSVR